MHVDRTIGFLGLLIAGCAAQQAVLDPRPAERPVLTVTPESRPPGPEQPAARTGPLPEESGVRIAFLAPSGRPVALQYERRARSVGSPTRGRLENARCLPESGPGFIAFSPSRCATDETITLLLFAIGEVMHEYASSVPVVIGALSRPDGGRIKPHKSHRSGRDVDIGYFAADNRPLRTFADLRADEIDYDKSFYLMAALIATGRVDFIFVNYALQPRFIEAARRMGYDDEQISYLFQYPKGRRSRTGVIRHARGHTRHFHVRFACPLGDMGCVRD